MHHKLAGVLAALVSLGTAQIVLAADLPVKAPPPAMVVAYSWTGFYIGVHAGGTWGTATATETLVPGGIAYNGIGNEWSTDVDGFVGGGQLGYNWQRPGSPLVFGIEGDIGYLGLRGQGVSPLALTQASGTRVTLDGAIYATARARLGVARNNWLFYGTGGAIFADVRGQITDPVFVPAILPSAHTGWQTGWTAGGGIEVGFNRWSVKVEYLYFDLGTENVLALHPGNSDSHAWDIETTGHIARVGLNRRF